MSDYWAGFLTPVGIIATALAVFGYLDRVTTGYIGWDHKQCRGTHQFRRWLPARLMRRTFMPASVWRCNRGAQVPLMAWSSQGRERSNDPEERA